MKDVDDCVVVERVLSGDDKAFSIIVKKYEAQLIGVVTKYVHDLELAKDVVQEGFFKTYMSLSKYEGRCSFKNWLYKITLNTARNKIRSLKRHENLENKIFAEDCEIEENLIHDEIVQKLRELVQLLPEKQQQSLELRVFEDMSFKQVANVMDCPYDTAKANYRHAMLKIKDMFKQYELVSS